MTIPPILKKKWLIFLIIVVIGGGVYAVVRASAGKTAAVQYVTQAATTGTLTVSVSGSGQIAASQTIAVSSPDSGKITSVAVKVGQAVKTGDKLLQIDPTNAAKAVRDARLSLQSAELSLANVKSPATAMELLQARDAVDAAQRNLDSLKTGASTTDLQNAEDAVTEANTALAQDQTSTAQDLTNAYEEGYNTVAKAFIDLPNIMNDLAQVLGTTADPEENVSFYNLIVNSTYTTKLLADDKLAKSSFDAASSEFRASTQSSDAETKEQLITDTLATEKLVANALQDAQTMLAAVNGQDFHASAIASVINTVTPLISEDVTTLNSSLTSLQSADDTMVNTKTNGPITINNDELTLAAKERALDDLKAGATADELATAEATLAEKQQALADLQAGPTATDLASAQLTATERQNALTDAEETLAKDTITAPIDGIVASLPVTLHATVGSGTTVATVISTAQTANLSLNEVDAAKVSVGQQTTLTFDALPDLSLTGHVVTVDTIGTVSQGVVNYAVTIALDTENDQIKPGMSVDANIITAVHQNVLTVPSSAVTTTNGSSSVQLLTDGKPTTVPVQIGLSNDTDTEIDSGLNADDMVITQTISANQKTSTTSTSAFSILGGGGGGGGFRSGGAVRVGG